jgi:hypothetical protein
MSENIPVNLMKKLVLIRKEIKSVKKSGHNKHQNYKYVTEADLVEVLREGLNAHDVLLFTSVEVLESRELKKINTDGKEVPNGTTVTVATHHTFVDADTGESYTVTSVGAGHDSLEKGIFKAITGSYKYMISKNFLIETDDDPERDAPVVSTNKPKPVNTASPKSVTPSSSFGGKKETTTETKKVAAVVQEMSKPKPSGFGSKTMSQPKPQTSPSVGEIEDVDF